MSDNPYGDPPRSSASPSGPMGYGPPNLQQSLSKVTPPAIALIVVGVLNILSSLWGLATSIMFMFGVGPGVAAQRQQLKQLENLQKEGVDFTWFIQLSNTFQGPAGIAISILQLAAGAFIIYGAVKMKNLQAYPLALGAAIVAMVPMLSYCCCAGIPIGIWAIVVLLDQNVKQSFPQ